MSTVPTDEQDVDPPTHRPWRTPRLPELVGFKGACEILGVQKMSLNRWMQNNSGTDDACFGPERTRMITPARVDSGPVWVRSDVEDYARRIGRQRAPAGLRAGSSAD